MPKLKFVGKFPERVPSELMVYSTETPKYGRTIILDTMRRLKLPTRPLGLGYKPANLRPEFRFVDNWAIGKRDAFTVAVNRLSGAIRFRDELRHGRELDKSFKIPESHLIDIARKFVDEAELLEQPAKELKVVKISYLRTRGASVDGKETLEQILDGGVIFQREIDNIPVAGFGGFVMVNIAHDESVVAATKIWRHRDKKLGKVKVLQPEYALKEFQRRLEAKGLKDLVEVLKSDFCYFEANDNTKQDYLEPTYAFVYKTKTGQFTYKSVEIVPAVEEPKQKWIFRKRFYARALSRS